MSRSNFRRRLRGGTALAIPAIAAIPATLFLAGAPARAAEAVVGSVGGYMTFGAGITDATPGGDAEVAIIRDGEIHFKAKGASDNGLTFEVRVELEAFTTTDQIDENWGKVSGAFGEIYVGGADTALNEYGGVGVVYASGPFNYYDPDVSITPGDSSFIGKDDALSIRYGTPVMHGFQAGISYQPNADVDGANDRQIAGRELGIAGQTDIKDQIAVGASWAGAVGAVDLAVGGGYLTADGPRAADMYHAGASVGYAGVTVAGFWNRDGTGGDTDRYGLGAMYKTGPWKVGGGFVLADGADEGSRGTLGATYALAPGVDAVAAVEMGDETGDGLDTSWGVATALQVRF